MPFHPWRCASRILPPASGLRETAHEDTTLDEISALTLSCSTLKKAFRIHKTVMLFPLRLSGVYADDGGYDMGMLGLLETI